MASQVTPVARSEDIGDIKTPNTELLSELDQYTFIIRQIEKFESELEGF